MSLVQCLGGLAVINLLYCRRGASAPLMPQYQALVTHSRQHAADPTNTTATLPHTHPFLLGA
jgi:hypothetical protein